jgi:hypothetical protein
MTPAERADLTVEEHAVMVAFMHARRQGARDG